MAQLLLLSKRLPWRQRDGIIIEVLSYNRKKHWASCSSSHNEPGDIHTCRLHKKVWRTQRRLTSSTTFVSKHYEIRTPNGIVDFCKKHGLVSNSSDYRENDTHVTLKECPLCTKPTRGKADNLYKCFIHKLSGVYKCHRCGKEGSWFDFKLHVSPNMAKSVSSREMARSVVPSLTQSQSQPSGEGTVAPLPMPHRRIQAMTSSALLDEKTEPPPTLSYLLNKRGLTEQTLRVYGVGHALYSFPGDNGSWEERPCVTFPLMINLANVELQEKKRGAEFKWNGPDDGAVRGKNEHIPESLIRRLKVRGIVNKAHQRMDPAGGGWGLFGYHLIEEDTKTIVLTEGEYDAMAVWQATGMTTLSLPNGARSLPVEVLPLLERFDKIYLWMDRDTAGQEGAQVVAEKLGTSRVHIVQPTLENCSNVDIPENLPKDANEALLEGLDLQKIIDEAKLIPHDHILHFSDLRENVLHEIIYPEQYIGSPIKSLPSFTKIISGFRRGEMTVITGPTGSGKTTFLGQISLDLAEDGSNVLWGSFEIKNTRLIHKLMQQFARQPLPAGDESLMPQLNEIADRFSELPFHFLKFHGGSDVDDVLDAMEYSVYVHDTEHVILDNMQFMVSLNSLDRRSTFDKFDVQDIAIEKFRKFATDKNVHVTLVVHPRKEQEGADLSLSSFYGSAKATQEADTVVILQNDGNRKFLDVKKNRFNGELGRSPLHFDRKSCRYHEHPVVDVAKPKDDSSVRKKTAEPNESAPVPKAYSDPWSSFL